MVFNGYRLFLLYLSLGVTITTIEAVVVTNVTSLNRSSFPVGFIFGTGSSAYQYEGAANEGGKGPSIWDKLTHQHPEQLPDRSNGDVAVDQYHRYKEDVGIMKYMNMDAYRFSISWPRILPKGKISGGINQEGIKYYNNLINELLDKGLVPFVTLFHWDLPLALRDEYGGFLSPNIINDFEEYAKLCYREFGDRVKHWTTVNEPLAYSLTLGEKLGEPNVYVTVHHLLLAHAAAVQIYRTNFQESQKGLIGMTLITQWALPYSNDISDHRAAKRILDYFIGLFMDPLTRGKYPHTMVFLLGNRLPKFTIEQSKLLTGSFDFIGINYYSSNYAVHIPLHSNNHTGTPTYSNNHTDTPTYFKDIHVNLTTERNGIPIGPRADSPWLGYPKGILKVLQYTKKKYHNPLIYITENGMGDLNDPTLPLEQALNDTKRIDYYKSHLYYVSTAIKHGVNVQGYFAWSLLDDFEWKAGYTKRFGINFVDYKDNLKRHQKLSAHWFKNFLQKY